MAENPFHFATAIIISCYRELVGPFGEMAIEWEDADLNASNVGIVTTWPGCKIDAIHAFNVASFAPKPIKTMPVIPFSHR